MYSNRHFPRGGNRDHHNWVDFKFPFAALWQAGKFEKCRNGSLTKPEGDNVKKDENGNPFEWAEIVPKANKDKGINVRTDNGSWIHLPGTARGPVRYWPDSKDPPEGWIFRCLNGLFTRRKDPPEGWIFRCLKELFTRK
jgi:hypothetical protein